MKTRKLWAWMILLASFAFVLQLSTLAKAQDQQDQDDDQGQAQDPPDRVGRLNDSQGSVSFRPAGEDDWVTAVPNRPLVTGDDLWADENSRAEVHIGSAAIRPRWSRCSRTTPTAATGASGTTTPRSSRPSSS